MHGLGLVCTPCARAYFRRLQRQMKLLLLATVGFLGTLFVASRASPLAGLLAVLAVRVTQALPAAPRSWRGVQRAGAFTPALGAALPG